MINKIMKDFDNLWDNRFLDWDLTDRIGMKERVKAFVEEKLKEQESECLSESEITKIISDVPIWYQMDESRRMDYWKQIATNILSAIKEKHGQKGKTTKV